MFPAYFIILTWTTVSSSPYRSGINALSELERVYSLPLAASGPDAHLIEMKERICSGFKFVANGPNCTLQTPKNQDQGAIASAFPECKELVVSQCRKRKISLFCEKGKQHVQRTATLALTSMEQMIRRNSLSVSVQGGGPSFPVDCLHTGELIRQSNAQSSGTEAFGRCCSICQKGRLYAIELGTCRHRAYAHPLLEFTFNECCFSRLYGGSSPILQTNHVHSEANSGTTTSNNDALGSIGSTNIANSGMDFPGSTAAARLPLAMLPASPKETFILPQPNPSSIPTAASSSINKSMMELAVWEFLQLFRRKIELDGELLNVSKAHLLFQTKSSFGNDSNETSRMNETWSQDELKQLQTAVQPLKNLLSSDQLMSQASPAASLLFSGNNFLSGTALNRRPATFSSFELFSNGANSGATNPLDVLTHSEHKWTLANGQLEPTNMNEEEMTSMLIE